MDGAHFTYIKVVAMRYFRQPKDVSILAFCQFHNSPDITVAFANDHNNWSGRHGAVGPSESPDYSHRAHFHCLGHHWLDRYPSFLDFTPGLADAVDHRKRPVHLELHGLFIVNSEEQLRELLMRERLNLSRELQLATVSRKRSFAVVD